MPDFSDGKLHKILITGGAGFLGTNIAIEATKRGYEVIVFDSTIRPGVEENLPILTELGVTIVRGDVRNREDLERIYTTNYEGMNDLKAIIHLASNPGVPWSISWPRYDFDVNAMGTLTMLEFARTHKTPFILASTNKVYPESLNELPREKEATRYAWHNVNGIPENYPLDGGGKYGHSPYGVSKAAADLLTQEYGLEYDIPVVVNRMSCIYGYYQKGVADQGWTDHFVRQFVFEKEPQIDIYGDGYQVRDMLWGEDVARLYLDEVDNIDQARGNVFNIGGGPENTMSLKECLEWLSQVAKKTPKITYHPWRPADQRVYISNVSKVQQVLGWRPLTSPKEGMTKMITKYKEEAA